MGAAPKGQGSRMGVPRPSLGSVGAHALVEPLARGCWEKSV